LCYDCCIFILLFNDVYVPFYLLGESVAKWGLLWRCKIAYVNL
jgi:hypothetical protein